MTSTAPELSYRVHGPLGASTVLFLHGFMGSGEDFNRIIQLANRGHCAVTVDLPGHGLTAVCDEPEACSMERCSDALARLVDRLGCDRVDLVGYSMGGRMALYFALAHPDRIRRLVLESASPGLRTEAERAQRREHDARLADRLRDEPFPVFLKFWYDQPLFASLAEDPKRLKDLVDKRLKGDPRALALSLLGLGTGSQPSLWDKLPTIAFPTLLIAGEKDRKFEAIGREMAAVCAAARLTIVEGAGHNVHLECPDRFAELIGEFLADRTGSRQCQT